ncbi:hypothetical protein C1T17_15500 [Sphingobium sp. SCG-1]|nr:hypothetical protein C1T17_15500 [Sphingobium sp. SCG-1]
MDHLALYGAGPHDHHLDDQVIWPRQPRSYACQKDRGAVVVGKIGAAADLVQRAGRKASPWQTLVDCREPEGKEAVPRRSAFDARKPSAKVGNDGRRWHGADAGKQVDSFAICSNTLLRVNPVPLAVWQAQP